MPYFNQEDHMDLETAIEVSAKWFCMKGFSQPLRAIRAAALLQVPVKPIVKGPCRAFCGSCGRRIRSGTGTSGQARDLWCNHCGTKIDWEE